MMNRSAVTLLLLGAVVALVPVPVAGDSKLCTGDGPQSVLACYASAMAQRDSSAYASLLAPDYVQRDESYPELDAMDYTLCLRMTARLFHAPNVKKIDLQFGEPSSIESGTVPGVWVVHDVPMTFRVEGTADTGQPGPHEVKKVVTFSVRSIAEPEPHYVIFREQMRNPEGK